MEAEEGGVLVKGRAIIDTRPPFQSVKEAVALFGERVLVGEIYAKKLQEMEPKVVGTFKKRSNNIASTTLGVVSSELEETKKKLQKEREEGDYIAICLKSVKEELDQTRTELMQLKAAKRYSTKQPKNINPEMEELNFVESPTSNKLDFEDDYGIHQQEYHRKKSVTFASPPSLTREIMHDIVDDGISQIYCVYLLGLCISYLTIIS